MFKKEQVSESIQLLKKHLKPGMVVYTSINHAARSGMSRSISCYIVRDGGIWDITGHAAKVAGYKLDDRHGGMKVGGCGMDMGFHIVYSLGHVLYPDGAECTGVEYGKGACRSNDHSNGDRDYAKGKLHSDGGYAFRHEWI